MIVGSLALTFTAAATASTVTSVTTAVLSVIILPIILTIVLFVTGSSIATTRRGRWFSFLLYPRRGSTRQETQKIRILQKWNGIPETQIANQVLHHRLATSTCLAGVEEDAVVDVEDVDRILFPTAFSFLLARRSSCLSAASSLRNILYCSK